LTEDWRLPRFVASPIRERGPMTVAAFMDLALYDPRCGYYARAARRSGRAGDFFTSVDVGVLFGELLEIQLAEMFDILGSPDSSRHTDATDLVEAGAGNGRLSADILRASRRRDPAMYRRIRLHLVEASAAARAGQRDALGEVAEKLVASSADLPVAFEGVLVANELLDALPVHQVVMREGGLREVYVDLARAPETGALRLILREGPLSTPLVADYLSRAGVVLETGWRAEINLGAIEWIRQAARRLSRGFIVIVDYGHEARELYSAAHGGGTLTAYRRHGVVPDRADMQTPGWLDRPGEQDLTAHVDFTSLRAAAEQEGLVTLGFLDQTYFLLGLLESGGVLSDDDAAPTQLKRRLALKTLLMPGGLGSTHKVLVFGKNVGRPSLRGCSFRQRVT
jgi:SAM-dependent MidA family methyltransferase